MTTEAATHDPVWWVYRSRLHLIAVLGIVAVIVNAFGVLGHSGERGRKPHRSPKWLTRTPSIISTP